jgi:hypothetical protein
VSRIALLAALEALEANDVGEATKVLLGAVEELEERPPRRRLGKVCPHCGSAFEWPGQLDHHLRFSSCWQRPGRAVA